MKMNKKWLSGVFGVLVALLLGAVVMLAQGYNPLETYLALFNYSLGDIYSLATTLHNAVPLVLTGLSASLAFAAGPVNLGQPGQLLMGALLATVGGLYLDLPKGVMIPLLLLLAMIGGALWSGLAALLRHLFNMSEFITTLMLNMIADFFTYWAISYPLYDQAAYSPMTPRINPGGQLWEFGDFNTDVLIMLLFFGLVWFLFQRTTAGYEWRMAGQNSLFARLGGCPIDRNYTRVMLISGALAGLAGGLVVMGGPHRFLKGIGANYAWDGVMIAMVANNAILGTLLYGVFFAVLQTGALGMELITAVPSEFIMMIQAVIVLVVVAGRGYLDIFLRRLAARKRVKERAS
jgi:simple sugar transport system permease protein